MLRNLQMAGVAAAMDVVTIAEFTAINFVGGMLISPVAGLAPPGMVRNLLAEGVRSAVDIAKLIVFSTNQAVTAKTG